jgi:hypothetical protein
MLTTIQNISPNESFDCSPGVDPQVGSLQKITIKNVRSAPIRRLLVREQIPG